MTRKKTQIEVEKEMYDLVGNEYTILNEYTGNKNKLFIKHNTCGNEYYISIYNFKKGNRCRKCVSKEKAKKRRKTHEQFLEEFYSLDNNDYDILSEYKGTKSNIKVKHKLCGTEYYSRADVLLRGSKCKNCLNQKMSKDNTKTTKQYYKEVNEATRGEYELLSTYTNVNTKVKIKHNVCGHEYEVFPYMFKRGRRCPKCNYSKGEKLVEYVLEELNKKYETQYKFIDLVNVKNLSYDFYLPKENILIEYQGQQHYHPVELFGGYKQFEIQKNNDNLKRQYAKDKDITLIEIPYTEDTYEKVKNYLLKYIK